MKLGVYMYAWTKQLLISNYEPVHMENQMSIQAGEPAYKLITDETWCVYVCLDKATADELKDTSSVKVRIDKDSETIWADFSVIQRGRDYFGRLEFDNSMIRYCEDRYLNVELILEDQSGLKIPKSSVIEKKFYTVPEEYLTTSGSATSQGVMVKEKEEVKYVPVSVYYTTEDGNVYLNPKDLDGYDTIIKPESNDTYSLKKLKKLNGVYNINQGYAVFKVIEILCENDDYYIVQQKTSYGLSDGVYNINQGYAVFKVIEILCENDDYYIVQQKTSYGLSDYDHIVQDGTTIKEDEVVFQ